MTQVACIMELNVPKIDSRSSKTMQKMSKSQEEITPVKWGEFSYRPDISLVITNK